MSLSFVGWYVVLRSDNSDHFVLDHWYSVIKNYYDYNHYYYCHSCVSLNDKPSLRRFVNIYFIKSMVLIGFSVHGNNKDKTQTFFFDITYQLLVVVTTKLSWSRV